MTATTDKLPWTPVGERWQMHLDGMAYRFHPPQYPRHESDVSVVYDALTLLRCFDVRRWSPETRELIYAAREAVVAADQAMCVELQTKEGR